MQEKASWTGGVRAAVDEAEANDEEEAEREEPWWQQGWRKVDTWTQVGKRGQLKKVMLEPSCKCSRSGTKNRMCGPLALDPRQSHSRDLDEWQTSCCARLPGKKDSAATYNLLLACGL